MPCAKDNDELLSLEKASTCPETTTKRPHCAAFAWEGSTFIEMEGTSLKRQRGDSMLTQTDSCRKSKDFQLLREGGQHGPTSRLEQPASPIFDLTPASQDFENSW